MRWRQTTRGLVNSFVEPRLEEFAKAVNAAREKGHEPSTLEWAKRLTDEREVWGGTGERKVM